jgi:hypothetical protein
MIFGALCSCSGDPDPRISLAEEVATVRPLFTVDTLVGGPFETIEDAVPLPSGGLVLLDAPKGQVHFYDRSGHHLRFVGAIGSGPAELRRATELLVGDGGRVLVNDIGNRRLAQWDTAGRFLGALQVSGMYFHLVDAPDGEFVKYLDVDESSGEEVLTLGSVPDPSTGEAGGRLQLSVLTGKSGRSATTCEFCPLVVEQGGTVLVGAPDGRYTIFRVDSSGAVLDSIWRTDLPEVRWGPEEAEAVLSAMRRKGLTSRPAFLDRPKRLLGPRSISSLSGGILVVMPATPYGTPSRLDFWADSDSLIASIEVPEPLVQIRGGDDRIVGVAEWPDGRRSVHVYAVRIGREGT